VGAEIRGDVTGRVWRYHPVADRLQAPGSGVRFRATALDDGSLACLHHCEKGTYWDDDVERLQHALGIARLPDGAAASTIRRVIDHVDREAEPGKFGALGYLAALWEWADVSLHDFLDHPDDDRADVADAVGANVAAALDVLHGAGIVHLDVAPANILRVEGRWKLDDLDSCARRGEPAERQPNNEFYVHPRPALRRRGRARGVRRLRARARAREAPRVGRRCSANRRRTFSSAATKKPRRSGAFGRWAVLGSNQ
jgi:hypothetical protein